MIVAVLAILLGFVVLVWSADRFIEGSAATANILGMPPLLIGIIIVGFGTSAPEMLVSVQAALDNKPELALGNAIGSNIINIGLVLGITALIAPIVVHSDIVKKEIPVLIGIGMLFGWFIHDGSLARHESMVLVAGFVLLILLACVAALRNKGDHLAVDVEQRLHQMSLQAALFWLVFGLTLMVISARVLVWGAVALAEIAGISNLVIGLTIVAFGTSLPELTASIVAAVKKQHDIAIGNVVGSNMFNLLAVAGFAGVIAPIENLDAMVFYRDWNFMAVISIALWIMAYGYGRRGELSRIDGFLLLAGLSGYLAYLASGIL